MLINICGRKQHRIQMENEQNNLFLIHTHTHSHTNTYTIHKYLKLHIQKYKTYSNLCKFITPLNPTHTKLYTPPRTKIDWVESINLIVHKQPNMKLLFSFNILFISHTHEHKHTQSVELVSVYFFLLVVCWFLFFSFCYYSPIPLFHWNLPDSPSTITTTTNKK